jgi:hypothetical protein
MKMDEFEKTLINLRVLQSLQCHNRLDTTQALFKIHTTSEWVPSWVRRWWAQQSRSTDLSRIQTLYNDAMTMLNDDHPQSERLRVYLSDSRKGLESLMTTYRNDPTIVARIEVILDSAAHSVMSPVP